MQVKCMSREGIPTRHHRPKVFNHPPHHPPHQHCNWQSMCAHKNVKHAHLISQTPISQAFRLDAFPSQGALLEQLIDRSAPASHARIAKPPAQRSLSLIPDSLAREIIQRHPPIIAQNKASWPQRGQGMEPRVDRSATSGPSRFIPILPRRGSGFAESMRAVSGKRFTAIPLPANRDTTKSPSSRTPPPTITQRPHSVNTICRFLFCA